MRTTIQPGAINGTIKVPSSKSITQRVLAAALLHHGKTVIHNAGISDDENAALKLILQLGAEIISVSGDTITIESNGINPTATEISCGESGLAARLFTPIASLASTPITITGNGTLMRRPMEGFKHVFKTLGVNLSGEDGFLPVTVHGPLESLSFRVDASFGSQLLSGLLFALCYSAKEKITIEAYDLKSKPYIALTIDVLRKSGKPVSHDNYKTFTIDPALFDIPPVLDLTVEGDWSSAAGLLVAAAISGSVTVNNLQTDSAQADKAILGILKDAGASVSISGDSVTVQKARLKTFETDATHCPDLFPVLAILAASCQGESYIYGVHRLFHKESNRAESIAEMLQNFNVPFSIEDDAFCVTGVGSLQGTVIDSYHDHRIAIAAAVGALNANGQVDILNSEAIKKSYTSFFDDLSSCGINISNYTH
ncbi:MAG: 3-phosphoshikimate 1-carboxyvinyltransferase [Taibaiella sp.]|nr:3-phosphoshikimate 1-carboxyvinyltransferase [Taibaiella sp.]